MSPTSARVLVLLVVAALGWPLAASAAPCAQSGNTVSLSRGPVRVDLDLGAGTASFFYDGARKVNGFYAGVQLDRYVTSKMYARRTCTTSGDQTEVVSTADGLPTMHQYFILMGGNRFLARVVMEGRDLASRWMAPVVMDTAGGVDLGSTGDPRVLWIPYDNDSWISYNAGSISGTNGGVSYEAAAFYDNANRHGLVVGSVTHDTWKTGIYYRSARGKLDALNVFGGATDRNVTHDVVAHGQTRGDWLWSPIAFVGYADDWRDLMEEYADMNAWYDNPLRWSGGVPFGWNSWGKLQDKLSYDKAIAVSDFVRRDLQSAGFGNDGTAYINLDSYWDNLSDAQLDAFVAHAHQNGQKAGIYWTPWVDWGKWVGRQVEGSSATYEQLWLRDGNGNPIELDGAYAIDPTHPATRARIDHYIGMFQRHGFEYIKLDFLSHGALESTVRYDPGVQTGTQAYNQGMRYLRDRIGGTMFISESIAPLFPFQYAHARRVSCDVYGAAVGNMSSQYELNSATYGWWMSGRLYAFNDPDHMVFEGFGSSDNMMRLMSGVVSGTVFLNGDDLTTSTGQSLARTYLTNPRVLEVARLGRPFRPVEGNTGTGASDTFTLRDGGTTYVATFNFGGGRTTRSIDLARAGLDGGRTYGVLDVWTGETWTVRGTLKVGLDGHGARLLRLQ
jgi:hypothetical protein